MADAAASAADRPIRLYIVDDEPLIHNVWRRLLGGSEFELKAFLRAREALAALETDPDVDVVVTDLAMPEVDGLELLRAIKASRPEIEVIVMTAHVGLEKAIAAVKQGAYQFLAKPFDAEQPALIVRQAAARKRARAPAAAAARAARAPDGPVLVAASADMRRIAQQAEAAARVRSGVLIAGEPGSGRELVARAIHLAGARRERPFLIVACASLEGALLEGELFGYTGAGGPRRGALEAADGGSLLLDDVGCASTAVQARLLRFIETGEVRPVGSASATRVDVRLLATVTATTPAPAGAPAGQARLRPELAHKLGVLALEIPPLRARREDILPLARHFMARSGARHGREVSVLDPTAVDALLAWPWPGNVRELENTVEQAVLFGSGAKIVAADLPAAMAGARARTRGADEGYRGARRRAMDEFDRAFVDDMLARANGNISEAARLAGLDRANFRRIMRRVSGSR